MSMGSTDLWFTYAQPIPIRLPYAHATDLEEAPVNNLNNPILLLCRHFVIARQTESTPENISSYVYSGSIYVGICTSPAITLNRNKRIRPIYRLHMHGL